MALKMNGTKAYPNRAELLAFAERCSVKRPTAVIERIADAMQATMQEHGHRGSPEFVQRMKREWDTGRMSVERKQFLQPARKLKQI